MTGMTSTSPTPALSFWPLSILQIPELEPYVYNVAGYKKSKYPAWGKEVSHMPIKLSKVELCSHSPVRKGRTARISDKILGEIC